MGAPTERWMVALGSCCLLLLLQACDNRPKWVVDAAVVKDSSQNWPEAAPPTDGGGDTFAGLTIGGCGEIELTVEAYICRGTAPLSLTFSSLAPPSAATFMWDFGDDTEPATAPSTDHVYAQPGTYTVVLVIGGPFGTISPPHLTQVSVLPGAVGGYCEEDTQCAAGRCLCGGEGSDCPIVLRGTCSAECGPCPVDSHCADLTVSGTDDAADWRLATCLLTCESDLDCLRNGFRCRELPAVAEPAGRLWQPTCFPDVLEDVGAGCRNADDMPDPARCLSGVCASLGHFGLCTDDCQAGTCPSYAVCATFTGGPHAGEEVCLARCDPNRPCHQDPKLACELESPVGELGFTVLDPAEPPGLTYCAPRRCAANAECPTGDCDLQAGGFCR
ncbi:MAG: PKD domain-containing protein [bacterium]